MKMKKSYRIQLGFLAGVIYLWRAEPTPLSLIAGAALMALGETIRFLAAGTLIKFEGVSREGIYAATRNPLYLGSFIIGAGACLMGLDIPFAIFYFIAFPVYYYRVIRREEAFLVNRYGDEYRVYTSDVPRIFPRRLRLGEIFGASASFLAVKNREHRTIMGIIAVFLFVAAKLAL